MTEGNAVMNLVSPKLWLVWCTWIVFAGGLVLALAVLVVLHQNAGIY